MIWLQVTNVVKNIIYRRILPKIEIYGRGVSQF